MRQGTFRTIRVTAADLPAAIGQALHAVVAEEGVGTGATYLLGFDAEAPTPEAVAGAAVRAMLDLAGEHRASIRGCEASGLRLTDGGYRLWGTIECEEAERSTRVDPAEVDIITVDEGTDGTWTVGVRGGEA